jgi:hypothetical protein
VQNTTQILHGCSKETTKRLRFTEKVKCARISSATILPRKIIVVKNYDCGQYYEEQLARDAFQAIPMPDNVAKALARFKGQLSILSHNGPEAEMFLEKTYFIAYELKLAMRYAQVQYPQFFDNGKTATAPFMEAPYVGLYHAKSTFAEHFLQSEKLNETQREHVACLMDYVHRSKALEFEEAEESFNQGRVMRHHFSKLFAPDDVVVRETDDGPICYTISGSPNNSDMAVQFKGWNWEFDGTFYKKESDWIVDWPPSENVIDIATLMLYPLKFADDQLGKRIRERGQKFWSCRKQRLVECESSTTSFEFRAVSCTSYGDKPALNLTY